MSLCATACRLTLIASMLFLVLAFTAQDANAQTIQDRQKRCDGGEARGCYNLGLMYYKGEGVRQDKVKAAELYTKACHGDYLPACNNLGLMYKNGDGVRQDLLEAAQLFQHACYHNYHVPPRGSRGYSPACQNLMTVPR